MVELLKKEERKWTNIILIVISLAIVLYIAYIKGWMPISFGKNVTLETNKELFKLNVKEKNYVGTNNKQIIHVTKDGIKAHNLEGEELWRDTLSLDNFVVRQKEPYVAVANIEGTGVYIFNEKGRKAEVKTTYPIVYFSINEAGGLVTIETDGETYIVVAHDEMGGEMSRRTTNIKKDGYPIVAELSPDNERLMISYVSVDEPQIVSRVCVMNAKKPNDEEARDDLLYAKAQKNNLVYEIEFINKDTWVTVGDKMSVWYDIEGNEKGKQQNLSIVFVPYLYKMSQHGLGYMPMIISEKPTQNIVHRQDELAYFNQLGEKTFSLNLESGVEYFYADENGVTVQIGSTFKGYDKLGNPFFEYKSETDASKVIYIPSARRGIAVNKENVLLLVPKKEKSLNG